MTPSVELMENITALSMVRGTANAKRLFGSTGVERPVISVSLASADVANNVEPNRPSLLLY